MHTLKLKDVDGRRFQVTQKDIDQAKHFLKYKSSLISLCEIYPVAQCLRRRLNRFVVVTTLEVSISRKDGIPFPNKNYSICKYGQKKIIEFDKRRDIEPFSFVLTKV